MNRAARGRYAITTDLGLPDRVRVAFDELGLTSEPPGKRRRVLPGRRVNNATDIPGFSMSSCRRVVVGPGGGLVVVGAGFQAAVQDADESVGQLA